MVTLVNFVSIDVIRDKKKPSPQNYAGDGYKNFYTEGLRGF